MRDLSKGIQFMPVCGNCHRIIFGRVGIHQDDAELYSSDNIVHMLLPRPEIEPYMCPYCNTPFEYISGPDVMGIFSGRVDNYMSYPLEYPN